MPNVVVTLSINHRHWARAMREHIIYPKTAVRPDIWINRVLKNNLEKTDLFKVKKIKFEE